MGLRFNRFPAYDQRQFGQWSTLPQEIDIPLPARGPETPVQQVFNEGRIARLFKIKVKFNGE